MRIIVRLVAASAFVLTLDASAFAQQIEWSKTFDMPKGQNLPQGVQADILGIAVGDSYAQAKATLQRLLAEVPPPPAPPAARSTFQQLESQFADDTLGAQKAPPLQEIRKVFYLPVPSGQRIEAAYVGSIVINRELPGSGNDKIKDYVRVHFSAPPSGQQVLAVERTISYLGQADQPRITPMLSSLKEKFKTEGRSDETSSGLTHWFQFDNGQPIIPREPNSIACGGAVYYDNGFNQADIPRINPKGQCDVMMRVTFNYGISKDHTSGIRFLLADNERAKADYTADYNFFAEYIQKVQSRPGGAAPKL